MPSILLRKEPPELPILNAEIDYFFHRFSTSFESFQAWWDSDSYSQNHYFGNECHSAGMYNGIFQCFANHY